MFVREATGLVREISAYRAFVLNLMFTSPAFMLIFLVIGQGLFPGANLPLSSLVALIPALLIAYVYIQFSAAFPRSGGDYIFVGRVLHPSLGFMVNWVLTIINISVIGVEAVWVTTMGLGPTLVGLSAINNDPSLMTLAGVLTQQTNQFIIGAVLACLLPALMFFGTNVAFKLQSLFFIITTISVIVFIAAMFGLGPAQFASNFNSVSSTSYDATIKAATSAGANLAYNSKDTLLGVVYTYLAVSGFWASAYVGGEVKRPERSQLIGTLVAPIAYIVLMVLVAVAAYFAMGHDFLASISYLALNGNSAYTLPSSPPILQLLGGLGTKNAFVMVILGVGLLSTLLAYMLAATFASVRCLFAWSFDSVIPTKFAAVHEKYGVPWVSMIAVIIVNLIFVYLTVYTTVPAFFTYVVTGVFISLIFVGLAAILFPYRRKDLFKLSPSITTKKIGGIYLITLLGIPLIIVSILIGYASLLPSLVGPLNPTYVSVIPALFIAGFVIYWVSYAIQKSRGIPVDKIHHELPPE